MRFPHGLRNAAAGDCMSETSPSLEIGAATKKDLAQLVDLLGVLFAQEADWFRLSTEVS